MIQRASSRYKLSLALFGLILLLWGTRFSSVHSASPMQAISPLPSPRPTVWGWSEPPPAPTLDVLLTPSQVRHFSLTPASPLPTPTPIPDFVPPQTALQITGQAGSAGWYRTPVSITFAITDNFFAGVTEVQLDQATDWTYREYYYPPVTIQAEGIHELRYYSVDIAQNREAAQSAQIRIDRTPPQTDEPLIDGNQLPNGWYNTPVTVTLTGQDALSGLAGFEGRRAAGPWQPTATTTIITTTTQQTQTWRARDVAGNGSPDQTLALWVDLTPPTTTHTVAALPAGGWYTAPVTVTLTAVDVGAGLFQSQYRLNHLGSWQLYGGPFVVTGAGVQTVAYQSSDRALNLEPSHSFTLPLDLAPPQLTLTRNPPVTDSVWSTTPVTVTLTAGGRHQLHLRAQDAATNRADLTTQPFGLDTLAPHTTVTLWGGRAANGWYHTPVTVTLATTDTGAGVATVAWRLNGGAWQVYTMPLLVTSERVNLLEYYAVDGAGNQDAPQYIVFSIDHTDPTTRVGLLVGEVGRNGWYISPVTLTLSAQDLESGLQVLEAAVDDQPWQPYTQPLRLAEEGLHQIRYRAGDAGGRIETTRTLTVALDLTAPVITSTLPATFTYANLTLPAFYTLTDSLSGVVTSTLLLDGAPYAPDQPLPLGSHQVDLTVVNGAGLLTRRTQTFVVVGGRLYLPLIGR